MTTNQLAVIEKKIAPLVDRANEQKIKNPKDLEKAVELLSEMNKIVDRVTEEREKVTKPLNEALRAERGRWKPVEQLYTDAIELLRSKMTEYQTEQVRAQKEAEMKIASRIGVGRGSIRIETAVKKLAEVVIADKEIATTSGLVQFREMKVLKINDISLIPREYMLVNEKMVLDDLKAGKLVPGAEINITQVIVNYR